MAWLAIVGAVVSAMGQKQQGDQQAEVLRANAQMATNESYQQQEAAKVETRQIGEEKSRMLGAQRAAYGASGVSIEGSPLEVMAKTAAQYERDAVYAGYGGDVKAQNKTEEAKIFNWMAGQKEDAGKMGALSSLIGGFGSVLRTR